MSSRRIELRAIRAAITCAMRNKLHKIITANPHNEKIEVLVFTIAQSMIRLNVFSPGKMYSDGIDLEDLYEWCQELDRITDYDYNVMGILLSYSSTFQSDHNDF